LDDLLIILIFQKIKIKTRILFTIIISLVNNFQKGRAEEHHVDFKMLNNQNK